MIESISKRSADDSPSPPTQTGEGGESGEILAFEALVVFLWRHAGLVLGCAALFAIATVLGVFFFVPPTYEASTTLVVAPATFSSALKPRTLSVQGYQKLLESDAVLHETKQRLVGQGVIEADFSLRRGRGLQTRILVSRRSEEKALAPIIEVVVHAGSPEVATAIANTWAEVYLEHNRELVSSNILSTVHFIEEQFTVIRQALEEAEQRRVEAADTYQVKIDEATIRWDRRIVTFRQETASRVARYHTETRESMEGLVAAAAGERKLPESQVEATAALDRTLLRITLLRTQLAQTPQFVELEKAVSDDALWQALVVDSDQLLDLQRRSLVTQEINPVYSELALELSRIELAMDSLPPAHQEWLSRVTAKLETVQRERSAGLISLIARRAVEIEAIEREKQQEVEALRRQRDNHLAKLDREIHYNRQMFGELAEKHEQAELARSEQNLADIQLGSLAVPPPDPLSRGLLLKGLLAAITGAIFGLFLAVWRTGSRKSSKSHGKPTQAHARPS